MRQGSLQLRDLHEDTAGPGQGREGGGDVPTQLCVDSIGQHYYQTIYNSLFGEGCHWMVTVSTGDRGDSNSQLHQLKFAGQIVRGQE